MAAECEVFSTKIGHARSTVELHVKPHLLSRQDSPTLPVDIQRHCTSLLHALCSIRCQDGGPRGLFRGVPTAVLDKYGVELCYFWVVHQLQSRAFEGFGFAGAIVVIPAPYPNSMAFDWSTVF